MYWVLDRSKFLLVGHVSKLIETSRERADKAMKKGNRAAVKDYFIVHPGLCTGLGVMEIANLKCGDIFIQTGLCSLVVRNSKGGEWRRNS